MSNRAFFGAVALTVAIWFAVSLVGIAVTQWLWP